MLTLVPMKTSDFGAAAQIRVNGQVRTLLKSRLLLLGLKDISFRGKVPNIENVTNALWLWFARLSDDDAERVINEAFNGLDAYMDGRVSAPEQRPTAEKTTRGAAVIDERGLEHNSGNKPPGKNKRPKSSR